MATEKKTEKKTTAPATAPKAAPASTPASEAPKGAKGSDTFWFFDPEDLAIMGGPGKNDPQPETPEDAYLFDDDTDRLKIDEGMVESMQQDGVRKPIVIVWHRDRFFVKDGRRRVVNARRANEQRAAGKKARAPLLVKCEIDSQGVSPQTLLDSFALNTMAEEHNFIAQARKLHALMESGMSKLAISKSTKMSRGTIDNRLELLKLHPGIQDAIKAGKLSPSAALPLCAIADHDAQWNAFLQLMEAAGDKSYGQQTAAKEVVAAAQAGASEGSGEGSGAASEDKPKPVPMSTLRKLLGGERVKNLSPEIVAVLQVITGEKFPRDVKDLVPEFVEALFVALGIPLTPPRKGEGASEAAPAESSDAPVVAEI